MHTKQEIEKRIRRYKRALFIYKLSDLIGLKSILRTSHGFCYFFDQYNLDTQLPELYQQKPFSNNNNINGYWYTRGIIGPRIKCLEDAIALAEENLKQN